MLPSFVSCLSPASRCQGTTASALPAAGGDGSGSKPVAEIIETIKVYVGYATGNRSGMARNRPQTGTAFTILASSIFESCRFAAVSQPVCFCSLIFMSSHRPLCNSQVIVILYSLSMVSIANQWQRRNESPRRCLASPVSRVDVAMTSRNHSPDSIRLAAHWRPTSGRVGGPTAVPTGGPLEFCSSVLWWSVGGSKAAADKGPLLSRRRTTREPMVGHQLGIGLIYGLYGLIYGHNNSNDVLK